MDVLTLVIVDELTPAAKKADEHNYLAWRGLTWDDMRARETAPSATRHVGASCLKALLTHITQVTLRQQGPTFHHVVRRHPHRIHGS
jgi:hypothetical protein